MEIRNGGSPTEPVTLATLDARLADAENWIRVASPPVTQLIWDQAYRKRRAEERDGAWKRWGVRIGLAAGVVGIISGLVVVGERLVQAAHLLGL